MRTKLIEQRKVLLAYCRRERKFSAEPEDTPEIAKLKEEKRKCHLGLTELNPTACGCCIWFDTQAVSDGCKMHLITDREIREEEINGLREEYRTLNDATNKAKRIGLIPFVENTVQENTEEK